MQTVSNLAELEQLISDLEAQRLTVYVRYSKRPAADCRRGHSVNHTSGQAEAGLSCNPLSCPAWYPVNGRTVRGWLAMQIRDYSYMLYQGGEGTRAWVLTGREVGRGSDNEPLVTDARPVAYLADSVIAEAIKG